MENDLAAWVTQQLNSRDWSQRKLAREAGLSHSHVANVIAGNRNPTFEFCYAIAKALGEPPAKVFRIAGLFDSEPSPDDPTLEELSNLIKNLSPAARREVLAYVRFRYQQERESRS